MEFNTSFSLLKALKALKYLMDVVDKEDDRSERRYWIKPFLEKRQLHSLEAHILTDIPWDTNDYKNFCRLQVDDFENLPLLLDPKIKKQDTVMRDSIISRTRLAITLRYIATGDFYRSLEFLSRVSLKTISRFIPEVLDAIITSLSDKYLKVNISIGNIDIEKTYLRDSQVILEVEGCTNIARKVYSNICLEAGLYENCQEQMPSNYAEWKNVANDFNNLWQFPHTLGAIDRKHIRIKRPPHAGSDFYNYKGFHSIVLLAVVDAHSRFIYIDVGGNGGASDVVLLKNSSLYEKLKTGKLNLPPDEALAGQLTKISYYFIGDDIFGIDRNLLKAYNRGTNLAASQEIFNYRLSRARMTVEMAFGRLASTQQKINHYH